jgi:hypothetical protein
MTGRKAKRLFLLLAVILFAFHVQAMDHTPAARHLHASPHDSFGHTDNKCDSACCSTAACCVQAVVAIEVDTTSPRAPTFAIPSQRTLALATIDPPDPPPRSDAA